MIYLDHAATSHPKPEAVIAAVSGWYLEVGVSALRGAGSRCQQVAARVDAVRSRLGRLCSVPPERIAFTSGATAASNMLLLGLLRPGQRVVTTAFEHAAVARPLRRLAEAERIELEIVAPRADGTLSVDDVRAALAAAPTDWLVFTHASNVTGIVLDAAGLCAAARTAGARTIVDASQTAGTRPLDFGADALFASAHKSLLGPPGLGFAAVSRGLEPDPWLLGGTGSTDGRLDAPPTTWPARFEPGTPNTPAILGLGAALEVLDAAPPWTDEALAWIAATAETLRERLGNGVAFQTPLSHPDRLPILSLTLDDLDPAEAGLLLDAAGVHARTGFHCAPWIHDHLGTRSGGTIRLSPGPERAPAATEAVVDALAPR